MLTKIHLPNLYKYREFNEYTEQIILNSELWYANPNDFNDPFDMNLSFKQDYTYKEIASYIKDFIKNHDDTKSLPKHEQKQQMKKFSQFASSSQKFVNDQNNILSKMKSQAGVVALSSRKDSILMWSHYASKHTGLIFEFNFDGFELPLNELPHEVEYIEEYELLSYAEKFKIRKEQMTQILLSKFIDWQYEKEYRIIDLDFQGGKKFKKEMLTKIIFGLKASDEKINSFIALCKTNGFEHVKFEKAIKRAGTFNLDFVALATQ